MMRQKAGSQTSPAWNRFYITYNPHFKEYHAIREATGCSAFSSTRRDDVVYWMAKNGQVVQLDLFK